MTPEERQLVNDLFDRLSRLESTPRDPDAERAIAEGLKRAPNAVYALVQTVLVQDEALKRADARIRELSGAAEPQEQHGSFLDTMRSAFSGSRTSVPSVRPGGPDPRWNAGGTAPSPGGNPYVVAPAAPQPGYVAQPGFGGGSFLGTAAASAAGMIGGSLLLNSISSMFGHHGGSAFAAVPPPQTSPWDNSAAGSDLARDAGVGDIGAGQQEAFNDQSAADDSQSAGLLDDSSNDAGNDDPGFDDGDVGSGDFGDFGSDDTV